MRCKTKNCKLPVYAKARCQPCYRRTIYALNSKPHKKSQKRYRIKHRAAGIRRCKVWRDLNPEYVSVVGHHAVIFRKQNKNYQGMPFCRDWNPKTGGSYGAGAQWIIANIGRRPSRRYQLHIVDRRLGFVPGNLAWVPLEKHQREEMISKLLLENQQLKEALRRATTL